MEGDCAAENVRGEIEKQKSEIEETNGGRAEITQIGMVYSGITCVCGRADLCPSADPRVGETPKMRIRERY